MIELDTLVTLIQDKLNDNSNELNFVLFPDTGDFEKAMRGALNNPNYYDRPINGVSSVVDSEIIPNQEGKIVATMTVKTEIVFPLPRTYNVRKVEAENEVNPIEAEQGAKDVIELIRQTITNVCKDQIVENRFQSDDVYYYVAGLFSLVSTGERAIRPQYGDSLSFIFNTYFTIVENGESSRADVFYLDGHVIPYLRSTVKRQTTIESSIYSRSVGDVRESQAALGVSLGHSLSVSLVVPSFVTKLVNVFKDYLVNGEANTVHVLQAQFGYKAGDTPSELTKNYRVLIESIDRTSEELLTPSMTISLVEATDNYEIISLPTGWTATEFLTEDIITSATPFAAMIVDDGRITHIYTVLTKTQGNFQLAVPARSIVCHNGVTPT